MKQSMVNIVWMGDAISPITPLCMKFYIQKDMYVRLNVYNLAGGVPQDVELCDTNLIISKKEVFKHMGLFYMYFSYPFKGLSYLDSKLLWKILRR